MMLRVSLAATVAALMTACSTPAIVYAPKDGPNDEPSGSVRPLKELLGQTPLVRLVLIHGMGDHCPGYGLHPVEGWLNSEAMNTMGLTAVPSGDDGLHLINVSVFAGGEPDPLSHITYAKRRYRLKLSEAASEVAVEAIEITWSPLTQWLKSNQLGYDSPSTTPTISKKTRDCVPPADTTHFAGKPPPERLWLDRLVKEQVFDRNLADAVLYVGTYGWVMERGVSEALCRATSSWLGDKPCQWSSRSESGADIRYVFVTHSLGSRMLYDTLLDLLGRTTTAEKNPFSREEQRAANGPVKQILARTAAFYMMANQISLLGLASVPHDARSAQGMVPYAAYLDTAVPENAVLSASPAPAMAPRSTSPLPRSSAMPEAATPGSERLEQAAPLMEATARFGDVLTSIIAARRAVLPLLSNPPSLEIVAFNDTNDLLTWHIPPWYLVSNESTIQGQTGVNFVNVFVQTSPKYLIAEDPSAAHRNYFHKKTVWEVIACGASKGVVRKCAQ